MKLPICFVIMGFGRKTDFSGESARTLDLDATYESIIKPAVTACGLECIRADEISHSGIIDKPMYQLLLEADLVIADISTANPNALYELGVRHALRPFSTIVIKELDGRFHFDLNHLATLQYKHLGEDIGAREAKQKAVQLEALVRAVTRNRSPDSPVYTFLGGLKGPTMTQAELNAAVEDARAQSDSLSDAIAAGRLAASESRLSEARDHFARACGIQAQARSQAGLSGGEPDAYLIQQLALFTYKAGQSGAPEERLASLRQGWQVIAQLGPESSIDPETLGIAGAIRRRLFNASQEAADLDAAVEFYGRGFELKRDYYNGENFANCLEMRARIQSSSIEADYDRHTALKVRRRVQAILATQLTDLRAAERSDYKWMLATMANVARALGEDGEKWDKMFRELSPAEWEIATFEAGRDEALRIPREHKP